MRWNRGTYLVDGLEHCGACHSLAICLGLEGNRPACEGGEAEGWHACALWAKLLNHLSSGTKPPSGVSRNRLPCAARDGSGPHVERGRQPGTLVDPADVGATAYYLASLQVRGGMTEDAGAVGPGRSPQVARRSGGGRRPARPIRGGAICTAICASCHEGDRPLPLGGMRLDLPARRCRRDAHQPDHSSGAGNPASAGGISRPIMPGSGDVLDDRQISISPTICAVGWPGSSSGMGQPERSRQREAIP